VGSFAEPPPILALVRYSGRLAFLCQSVQPLPRREATAALTYAYKTLVTATVNHTAMAQGPEGRGLEERDLAVSLDEPHVSCNNTSETYRLPFHLRQRSGNKQKRPCALRDNWTSLLYWNAKDKPTALPVAMMLKNHAEAMFWHRAEAPLHSAASSGRASCTCTPKMDLPPLKLRW